MIKAPSLIKSYVDHWSEDPAFTAPPRLADDATDAEREQHKQAVADYIAKLTVATETGDWSALRIEGATPTSFTLKPLSLEQTGTLIDMRDAGAKENELFTLAFRCALVSVTNLGDVKVQHTDDERFGRIATLSFFADANITGGMGLRIVRELGARVLTRALSLSPKS